MGAMDEPTRIHRWRKHLQLTLQELADRCDLSVSCVGQAETGSRQSRQQTLRTIVERGLKLTMERFYGKLPPARRSRGPKVGRPRTVTSAA